MERPEIQDVHKLLRDRKALIVHFSGCPPMRDLTLNDELLFPADLKRVVSGGAQGGVSCSVILPGDVFSGPKAAAIGSIGVIVRMSSKDSLKFANTDDHGTSLDENNNRIGDEQEQITIEDLAASIEGRTKHSEWVLRDFDPVGLFAADPYEIWQQCSEGMKVEGLPEEFDDLESLVGSGTEREIKLPELRQAFPGMEVYGFLNGDLVRWEGGTCVAANHEALYPVQE